jgi:hypothetical protein
MSIPCGWSCAAARASITRAVLFPVNLVPRVKDFAFTEASGTVTGFGGVALRFGLDLRLSYND